MKSGDIMFGGFVDESDSESEFYPAFFINSNSYDSNTTFYEF